MLIDHSDKHGLALWQTMGRRFKGNLGIKTGDHDASLKRFFNAIDALHEAGFALYHTEALAEYAEALAGVGHIAQGLVIINRGIGAVPAQRRALVPARAPAHKGGPHAVKRCS